MRINIKQSDCNYIIDPAEHKVYCTINVDPFCVWNFVVYNGYPVFNRRQRQRITMPASFMGMAKCSPEDEWDVEVGKTIAFNRAKRKFCESFFKRASYLIQCYDDMLDSLVESFNDFGNKLTINNRKRENRVATYMEDNSGEVQSTFGV